jgi:hypothetical protein
VGGSSWNLDYQASVALVDDDYKSDEKSVVSTGSAITVETTSCMSSLLTDKTPMVAVLVTPCSFSVTLCSTVGSSNISPSSPTTNLTVRNNKNLALLETPPEARPKVQRQPDDCHVLIRWSQLEQFIKTTFYCQCGKPISQLERRTIGIATEIDFYCSTTYVEQKMESTFLRRERRIDSYKLNWRLIMAMQLMGELQVGSSIIGMFLDLTQEAFRNSWSRMEDLLGVKQREIGQQCCNLNLLKETMGKEGIQTEDGSVRYPIHVSYDMGWQKLAKSYDSLSGHGLLIGNRTKTVVAFQSYSKACGVCERHEKKNTERWNSKLTGQ